ncbi:MAG: hypothetical protein ACYS0K_11235 [Planctomycetota bacterium]
MIARLEGGRRFALRRTAILLGAVALLASVLRAQEAPWDADQIDVTAIKQSRAEAHQRFTELKDATADDQKDLREAAGARVGLLDQLLRTLEEGSGLLSVTEIERRKQEAETASQQLKQEDAPRVVARATADLAPYEQAFRAAEAEHKARKDAFDELAARRKSAEEELRQLPGREADAKKKLETARENGAAPLATYRAANLRLEVRLLQERGNFLRSAMERWALRVQMQQAELDLSRFRFERAKARLTRARELVAEALKGEAKEEKERADTDAKDAERERDTLARFGKSVQAEIDRLRADSKQDQATLAALDQRFDTEKAIVGRLDEELRRLKERLEVRDGMSERTARLLQKTLSRTSRRRAALKRTTLPKLDQQMSEYLGRLVL